MADMQAASAGEPGDLLLGSAHCAFQGNIPSCNDNFAASQTSVLAVWTGWAVCWNMYEDGGLSPE